MSPEGKGSLSHSAASTADKIDIAKAGGPERAAFVTAVNRTLADEAAIKDQIAIFKEGVNLTSRLSLAGGTGWFVPLVRDLLGKGLSVVVNGIGLIAPVGKAVERLTGVPADWVFQQNLYITPPEIQGFVPHCDPHVVVVAHLYGRKEWFIYDRQLDNPVLLDGHKEVLVADPKEKLPMRQRIVVEPGDVFVIPRGMFHAARALDGGSVHMAIGCAGVRPVDVIWAIASQAMARGELRADMDLATAQAEAKKFYAGMAAPVIPLPRNPVAAVAAGDTPPVLCFEEALRALPRR